MGFYSMVLFHLLISRVEHGSLVSSLSGETLVTLLSDGQLHSLALRQRHPRLRSLSDHEDVREAETTQN